MGCRDNVSEFIKRYGVLARLERFDVEVSTVEGAVKATGSPPSEIIKTLIVKVGDGYAAIVVTGDRKIALSKVAKVLKSRTLRLANYDEVREVTGFEIGGVSPLSDCVKVLRVVFDYKVLEKNWVWCGGGDISTLAYVSIQDLSRVLQPIVADVSKD
ncbi:MAG: YbaK/EbsC family protein [Sulfolobales archaeon]